MRTLLAAGIACLLLAPAAPAQLPLPPPGGGQEQPPPPPPEPPPAVDAAAPGTQWTTFAGDGARRSASGDASITPPFGLLWSVDLGTRLSYPLIADGRVFVSRTNGHEPQAGAVVEAFEATTGVKQWSTPIGQHVAAAEIAYGGGRVFAHDANKTLYALDAATGAVQWRAEVNVFQSNSPVVAGDTVYVQEDEVVALDVATGARRWQQALDGAFAEPALAGDRLYAAGADCGVSALDRRDGRVIWTAKAGCRASGREPVVLWRDRVGGRDQNLGARRMSDGEPAGGPWFQVAVDDVGIATEYGHSASQTRLVAHDLNDGRELWRSPFSLLLGIPGHVLAFNESVVSADERSLGEAIVARDARTGAIRWAARVLTRDARSPTYGGIRQYAAAGEGIVVVPHGNQLTALAPLARARPEPIEVKLSKRPDVEAGSWFGLSGTTGSVLAASRTTLEANVHPFRGFRRVKEDATEATGLYRHSLPVRRNTRLRVVTADGRVSRPVSVYVYPRIRLFVSQRGGLVRARMRVLSVPRIRALRGRRVALYLGRRGSRRLARIDAARLGRGRSATFVFRPLPRSRVTRRAYLLACVAGAHRLGLGRADVLSRRCGRRVIRF
ncbi:MAG TPA: PQQ-binding-like beta-propeller repeat protein [Solirubrobacteraceae bacterium]|nr:PQQ-binding-like beta-propeller repeat protein [Solirubrobacteraceae bacterium]